MGLAIQLPSGESPDAQEYLREYYKTFHVKLMRKGLIDIAQIGMFLGMSQ
jgi:hypothetical protein